MNNPKDMDQPRFLIIDGHGDQGLKIANFLQTLGLECDQVSSHLQALALTEDKTYEGLFITASGMDISGFEFCALLRARERRRLLSPSYLILICEHQDLESVLDNVQVVDDYLLVPWLDLELQWKTQRAVQHLTATKVKGAAHYFLPSGKGLLTEEGLRVFLLEEVNRVGRRQGWFSLSILSFMGLENLRISYGQDWLSWFKTSMWTSLQRQLRNYDRLAVMDSGQLCLISPDLDHQGTINLLERLEKVLSQSSTDHESSWGAKISLGATYLCVQVVGPGRQWAQTGQALWQWLREQLHRPPVVGVQGRTGVVDLEIKYD